MARYRPEWRSQLVGLYRHLTGPDPELNDAYFRWKHEENPRAPAFFAAVALDGDRVVAMRGLVGARWRTGEGVEAIPCATDAVVLPAYRNRGIFSDLNAFLFRQLASEGYRHVLSLSAGEVTYLAQLATGWTEVGVLESMRRPRRESLTGRAWRRVRSFVRQRSEGLLRGTGWNERLKRIAAEQTLDRLDRRIRRSRNPHITVTSAPRPGEMTGLTERLEIGRRIRQVYDETFYSWRFDNPRSSYRFLWWRDSELRGYTVLSCPHRWRGRECAIVDWRGTDLPVRLDMLDLVIKRGPFDSVQLWVSGEGEQTKEALRGRGFVVKKHPGSIRHARTALMIRSLSSGDEPDRRTIGDLSLLKLESWDLRMLDSDAF